MESRLVTLLRKVLIEKNFDLKLDKRLYSEFTVLKVKKKTVIIKENDKLDYLYLLVRGSANVVHFTPVGELIVFNHITNTSIFGLLEFMDNKHDFYKSVAFFKDTRLIRIPVERFEKEAESIELLKIYNQFLLDFAKHSIATFDLTKNYGRKKNLIEFFLSK
ncbi:cyclic nucleotide-binding domain-containing protein, partial [Parvimonas micra]